MSSLLLRHFCYTILHLKITVVNKTNLLHHLSFYLTNGRWQLLLIARHVPLLEYYKKQKLKVFCFKLSSYSKLGASSVGLDSKTSELDPSGSSKRSLDWIDSLYAGVCLKSVAPSLYVETAIPHAINCKEKIQKISHRSWKKQTFTCDTSSLQCGHLQIAAVELIEIPDYMQHKDYVVHVFKMLHKHILWDFIGLGHWESPKPGFQRKVKQNFKVLQTLSFMNTP